MSHSLKTSFASLILIAGVVFAGCGNSQDPAITNPRTMARATLGAAKATTSLTAQSIQAVLHQVQPTHFGPSNLDQDIIHFTPLPDGSGGTLTLDFGEGKTVDTLTVAGQIVSTFSLSAESLTIRTAFTGTTFRYYEVVVDENGEETGDIIDRMLQLDGTLTTETSLTLTTATCTIRGPLTISTYMQEITLNFNSVTAVLNATQGTMVFNGPVRIVTQDFGNWRVTFKNLLFRAKIHKGAIDIDSGRVIQERLATLIKWKAVYVFLEPNKGEVTYYPGKITVPFDLGVSVPPPSDELPE